MTLTPAETREALRLVAEHVDAMTVPVDPERLGRLKELTARVADGDQHALAALRKTAPREMPACGHCGRRLPRFEAAIGDIQICHPDDPDLPDCYHLVTVWHEELGSRLAALRKTAPEVQRSPTAAIPRRYDPDTDTLIPSPRDTPELYPPERRP